VMGPLTVPGPVTTVTPPLEVTVSLKVNWAKACCPVRSRAPTVRTYFIFMFIPFMMIPRKGPFAPPGWLLAA